VTMPADERGTRISRRRILQVGAVGALGMAAMRVAEQSASTKSASKLSDKLIPKPYAATFERPPLLTPYNTTVDPDGVTVQHYSVTEQMGTANIIAGRPTPIYGYNGGVPGPTIQIDQGTRVQLKVRNKLPAKHPQWGHDFNTSTHLHGSASLPQYDGTPAT
jgi:spore coat protein A